LNVSLGGGLSRNIYRVFCLPRVGCQRRTCVVVFGARSRVDVRVSNGCG
jgi:hypothetical protein